MPEVVSYKTFNNLMYEIVSDDTSFISLVAGTLYYLGTYYMRLSSFLNKYGRFPSWTEYREFQGGEDERALKWLRYFCYLLFMIVVVNTWLKLSST